MWKLSLSQVMKTMILWLTEPLARQIVQHALAEAPHEACGLIGGLDGCAEVVIPVSNVAADPRQYYEMDHPGLVRAMFEIEHRGLELIGIYHSHPSGEPIPSQSDIRLAHYPGVVYVIVSLRGESPRLAGWFIKPLEVDRVALHIGVKPPAAEPPSLSKSHKIAIVIGAILAFAFMMIVSLSLLPPPPELP